MTTDYVEEVLRAIDPVSYTHLDVYKRQGHVLATELLHPRQGLIVEIGRGPSGPLLGQVPAVSYTHLDVYKRQAPKSVEGARQHVFRAERVSGAGHSMMIREWTICLLYTSRCV